MRNSKSTLDQFTKHFSAAAIIEFSATKNLKGGGDPSANLNDDPPPWGN